MGKLVIEEIMNLLNLRLSRERTLVIQKYYRPGRHPCPVNMDYIAISAQSHFLQYSSIFQAFFCHNLIHLLHFTIRGCWRENSQKDKFWLLLTQEVVRVGTRVRQGRHLPKKNLRVSPPPAPNLSNPDKYFFKVFFFCF